MFFFKNRNSLGRLIGTALLVIVLGFFFLASANAEERKSTVTKFKIRNIKVVINPVFEGDKLSTLYRTANKIKIETKEIVVRQELLFAEGDFYDPFLIEESMRNLRRISIFRGNVSIVPSFEGDLVDLLVTVQDTWTLYPAFSFTSGGGTQKTTYSLIEEDVLGYGKRFEALYSDDEGRQKVEGVWDDERFMGTKNRLLAGYFDRSDGHQGVAFFGRPFRSLAEPYSWGISEFDSDLVGRRFKDSDVDFIYRDRTQHTSVGYTKAVEADDKKVTRITFGYDYLNQFFSPATAQDYVDADVDPDDVTDDPSLLSENRRFSGPFAAYQMIEPDFVSLNHVDRFERIEDFNLGRVFTTRLVVAPNALGSTDDTLILSMSDSEGKKLSASEFIRGQYGLTTRIDTNNLDNNLFFVEGKYFNVIGESRLAGVYIGQHTIVGSLDFDYGDNMDKNTQYVLGATNGLRGYEDRTFTGDKKILFNVEDRFHLVEDVLKLVSIGGAFFLDVGGASEESLGNLITDKIYSDVGFGLRFGFPRSSGGSVFRVDVAFPLRDGPDGSNKFDPRFIASTTMVVNGRLREPVSSVVGGDVSVGLE